MSTTTIHLLDRWKEKQGIQSDYAAAKALGITAAAISKWRKGKGHAEADLAARMASALHLETLGVLAAIEADRATKPSVQAVWRQFGKPAFMTLLVGFALSGAPAGQLQTETPVPNKGVQIVQDLPLCEAAAGGYAGAVIRGGPKADTARLPAVEAPVTHWLMAWRDGDTGARDRLIAALYPELRRLAEQLFRRERRDHTLQPTALVNEAWLRLSGRDGIEGDGRGQLFAIAAHLMREILIDHARRHTAAKRDGGERVTLTRLELADERTGEIDLLDLDKALRRLERVDATKARVVELRYFGGLSIEETAQAMALSIATVKRHWQAARIWLFDALSGRPEPPSPAI